MPDQLGGQQRYVRELAGALAATGARVSVLSKRVTRELPRRELASDGVELRRFDVPARSHAMYAAGYPLASLIAIAHAVRRHRGVLHVHYALQGAAPALMGADYVQTFHAPMHRELLPERQGRYRLPRALEKPSVSLARRGEALIARRARSTIVLTRYMRDQLSELAAAAATQAVVVPGGIDAHRFCPGPGIAHAFADGGAPLLFTARRLVPRTGVSELLEAMQHVLAELPAARLAIAGDGPLRADLEQRILGLGLAASVLLLGRVSEDDLLAWYRRADLFVLPTQELEGFGISTIEALSCGTPAVGTPVGGTPEILAEVDSRLLAASRSPRDLATAIVSVAKPEGLVESLAKRARARVVPSMSWPTVADRHLEIYETLRA
ncbi:MAG TPA: glycosyltransferase family 4 protein [Solirubrobacteraceae bacterium]|nr:glycosyltransferase family 4 protein [Solirubrobacteraceae bacterium]